jgi:hypothetical protein
MCHWCDIQIGRRKWELVIRLRIPGLSTKIEERLISNCSCRSSVFGLILWCPSLLCNWSEELQETDITKAIF